MMDFNLGQLAMCIVIWLSSVGISISLGEIARELRKLRQHLEGSKKA